jgi:hypothetical protein
MTSTATNRYNYGLGDANLLTQQTNNFYFTNDASFVFEWVPMNVSATYQTTPVFQPYAEASGTQGFIDVSATAYIEASANNFSRLFCFRSNDTTFTNYPNQDISYGITDSSTIFNISFSQALIKNGWANAATAYLNNTSVNQDYVRYTAKAITGGYALSDIFSNEVELINGVDSLDASFNALLNYNISTHYNNFSTKSGMGLYPDNSNNQFVVSCKQLLDGLLANASTPRGTQFLDDLEAQNTGSTGDESKTYFIPFHAGDVLAVRLAYIPKNGNNTVAGNGVELLGDNKLFNRTYKMFIKFT